MSRRCRVLGAAVGTAAAAFAIAGQALPTAQPALRSTARRSKASGSGLLPRACTREGAAGRCKGAALLVAGGRAAKGGCPRPQALGGAALCLWWPPWCFCLALESAAALICAILLLSAWRKLSSMRWSCSKPCREGREGRKGR